MSLICGFAQTPSTHSQRRQVQSVDICVKRLGRAAGMWAMRLGLVFSSLSMRSRVVKFCFSYSTSLIFALHFGKQMKRWANDPLPAATDCDLPLPTAKKWNFSEGHLKK
jgi:hypothetical protein